MGLGMFLGTMAKKPVVKQAIQGVKDKIDLTKEDKNNVGIAQIWGGAGQAQKKVDEINAYQSKLQNALLEMDSGFYGHNKVPESKQDKSGFYKHSKKVGNTLF